MHIHIHIHVGGIDAKLEALHADVLRLTGERDSARKVSETAVDTAEATMTELALRSAPEHADE